MGEKIRWPKDWWWCTGGKNPRRYIPKFYENGAITKESPLGCSHENSVTDCTCECHKLRSKGGEKAGH